MTERPVEPDWAALGQRIREQRVALGLSKTDAAKAAMVSLTTWRGLETGTNTMPNPQTLNRVANALHLDPREVFTLAGRADEIPPERPRRVIPPVGRGGSHRLAALLAGDPILEPRDRELLVLIYDFFAASRR